MSKDKIGKFPRIHGIIPLTGMKKINYNVKWVDMLTIVNKNYTIIEKSVFECLNAGCMCVWLICDQSIIPLLKEIVGEWAYNPTDSYKMVFSELKIPFPEFNYQKYVPIYYMPLKSEDMFEKYSKNSLGWSIIHGFNMANFVSKRLTQALIPDQFYVCFPYGMYDCREIRIKKEQNIKRGENVFYTFQGKSAMDKEYLPFYCANEYTEEITRYMKKRATNLRIANPLRTDIDDNFYDISSILKGSITMPEKLTGKKRFIELSSYERIDTWNGYLKYMRSDMIEKNFWPENKREFLNVENIPRLRSKVFDFDESKRGKIGISERILRKIEENRKNKPIDWQEWQGENDE